MWLYSRGGKGFWILFGDLGHGIRESNILRDGVRGFSVLLYGFDCSGLFDRTRLLSLKLGLALVPLCC